MQARARATDPVTSYEAADAVERSGKAKRQREICLEAVKQYPNHTAAEIADLTGLERHVPSRRLPELREAGLVRNTGKRICTVTNNVSLTWEEVK